jgi:hypothetical protein
MPAISAYAMDAGTRIPQTVTAAIRSGTRFSRL